MTNGNIQWTSLKSFFTLILLHICKRGEKQRCFDKSWLQEALLIQGKLQEKLEEHLHRYIRNSKTFSNSLKQNFFDYFCDGLLQFESKTKR